jgi:hypothetical protein
VWRDVHDGQGPELYLDATSLRPFWIQGEREYSLEVFTMSFTPTSDMRVEEKGQLGHVEEYTPTSDASIGEGDGDFNLMGSEEERRLTKSILRKLDTRMLPMLAVLFLFSFLDRTNIGNAKILGLLTDLKLSGYVNRNPE